MSLKDIEKLKERVDKDPNSKLFVPLAEEYRKEGMLDEAIGVLTSGIERQPGYMSARVSLGKIFLEKGMTNEARSEFENVIKSIPDNLYAHKKLAEIYRELGQKEMSIQSYKTVLKLNAMDEDALSTLRELEEEEMLGIGEAAEAHEESSAESVPVAGEVATEEVGGEPLPAESQNEERRQVPETPAIDAEDLTAFKNSIFGDKASVDGLEVAVEVPYETVDPGEEELEELVEVVEDQAGASDDELSFAGVNVADEEPYASVFAGNEPGGGRAVGQPETAAQVSLEKAGVAHKAEDADRFIAEGNYLQAMHVYRSILSSDPDNRTTLQRVEELRALLKLMGKDKETLISNLNAFLEGVRKRRNEFYGST
jgi:tetratricopeptide (TPR) repeat protein